MEDKKWGGVVKENEEEEVEEGKQWCMPHFDRLQNQVLVPIPREQQPHGIRGEVPEGVRAILHVHYIIEVNLKFCKCCCHGEPKKKKGKASNCKTLPHTSNTESSLQYAQTTSSFIVFCSPTALQSRISCSNVTITFPHHPRYLFDPSRHRTHLTSHHHYHTTHYCTTAVRYISCNYQHKTHTTPSASQDTSCTLSFTPSPSQHTSTPPPSPSIPSVMHSRDGRHHTHNTLQARQSQDEMCVTIATWSFTQFHYKYLLRCQDAWHP